ncbi:MAG: Fur family transcriptional regulator [Coleofasciculus sp. D1-CHI-01]|uniref:Fur family transcriptional regulator n=1 Tax=Coleofasciculus sp. D1-CHI-01 TaxID=3068482 RepID=UPI003304F455
MKAQRTRSQERILKLLKTLNRAVSAQDIHIELRKRKQGMGLATVYRSLDALKLEGVVQMRTLSTGESLYSLLQDQHHLTCLNCGRSIPIEECPVHNLETQLQDNHHFQIYYHTLEFFGLCEDCQMVEADQNRRYSAKGMHKGEF